jgi:4'-phosphopantetheinyl transferase EntD
VIELLLPPTVEAVEAFGDAQDARIFPEEEAAIARAVDARRREFTTARACARAGLARLGLPPSPIVPGERGAPSWPHGVVGSMTHCAGYRAAAVALSRHVAAIGIDAEPHEPLPRGVLALVALPREREQLDRLGAADEVCWDRVLFSTKESVYKAWYPLTGRWLDFAQADVEFDPTAGTFTARLLVNDPRVDERQLSGFAGRWLVRDGLILTAVVEPAAAGHRGGTGGSCSGRAGTDSWAAAMPQGIGGNPCEFRAVGLGSVHRHRTDPPVRSDDLEAVPRNGRQDVHAEHEGGEI